MKGRLRPMTGFESVLWNCIYYSLMVSLGIVLIQLVVPLLREFQSRPLYDLYRWYFIFVFYSSFGIRLCFLVMIYHRWRGVEFLLPVFGWVIIDPVPDPIISWARGDAVSSLDLTGALVSLLIYLIFLFYIAVSIVFDLRFSLNTSSGDRANKSAESEQVASRGSRRIRTFAHGQGILLNVISFGLVIDSVSLLWQNSHRWQTMRLDRSLLSDGYFYGHEFFIPVFFNLLAVVLIFRGWPKSSFWLPYLLIFLSYRAFNPPWEGWLPTPLYVVWVDRALVVLIMVNTLWTFLNWLNTRRVVLGASS